MLAHTLLQWLTELRAEAANVKVGIIPKHFAPSSKSQTRNIVICEPYLECVCIIWRLILLSQADRKLGEK